MQAGFDGAARRFNKVLFSVINRQSVPRSLASVPTGRPADPEIHSVDHASLEAEEPPKATYAKEWRPKIERKEPFEPPKPPYAFSPRLERKEVDHGIDPTAQQKRRHLASSKIAAAAAAAAAGELQANCAGLDGTPLPEDTKDKKELRKEQEKDDKECFKQHKASPLSELEVANTRKPITRATDGTADSSYYGEGSEGVILWRPEQLDTAEEALLKAIRIWKENAMRVDPDSPHGRVLRMMRGEYW